MDQGGLAAIDVERLSPAARCGELAWLNLRRAKGIELADFHRRTGEDAAQVFAGVIEPLADRGLLIEEAGSIRLSEAAWPLADGVAAEFLAAGAE
ncbi:MAG: hypothetical protein AAGK78_03295 [Planctomycetota bacterium]